MNVSNTAQGIGKSVRKTFLNLGREFACKRRQDSRGKELFAKFDATARKRIPQICLILFIGAIGFAAYKFWTGAGPTGVKFSEASPEQASKAIAMGQAVLDAPKSPDRLKTLLARFDEESAGAVEDCLAKTGKISLAEAKVSVPEYDASLRFLDAPVPEGGDLRMVFREKSGRLSVEGIFLLP